MKLLLCKGLTKSVTTVVPEMVNNLLSLSEQEDVEEDVPAVHVNHMVKLDKGIKINLIDL